jgi:hypothetical protein
MEVRNKLAGNELPPIFFCKAIPGDNNFQAVNSKFFDKFIQEVVGEVDYKIRIQKSDYVLRGQDSRSPTELSGVFHVIQSELKGFLQND